jgi:hypothetical protein
MSPPSRSSSRKRKTLPALIEEVDAQFEAVEFDMISEPDEEPMVGQAGGGE